MKNPFRVFNKFDWALWICSLIIITVAFAIPSERDYYALAASLIGITGVIFTAKGHVFGQITIVVFAVFYGIISYARAYYGEMITYLGMSTPIAIVSVIAWLKNPYKNTAEVSVAQLTKLKLAIVLLLTAGVTTAFYFILRALGTANLIVSTISVATSFLAVAFSVLRSPLYAAGYALNDLVLIVLWAFAAYSNISALPVVICFTLFLICDIYGLISWRRMQKRQTDNGSQSIQNNDNQNDDNNKTTLSE